MWVHIFTLMTCEIIFALVVNPVFVTFKAATIKILMCRMHININRSVKTESGELCGGWLFAALEAISGTVCRAAVSVGSL